MRRPRCRLQCLAGHCNYHRSVFFFLFFSPYFAIFPTSGKPLRLKICFPQYFGITRRYFCFIKIYSLIAFLISLRMLQTDYSFENRVNSQSGPTVKTKWKSGQSKKRNKIGAKFEKTSWILRGILPFDCHLDLLCITC